MKNWRFLQGTLWQILSTSRVLKYFYDASSLECLLCSLCAQCPLARLKYDTRPFELIQYTNCNRNSVGSCLQKVFTFLFYYRVARNNLNNILSWPRKWESWMELTRGVFIWTLFASRKTAPRELSISSFQNNPKENLKRKHLFLKLRCSYLLLRTEEKPKAYWQMFDIWNFLFEGYCLKFQKRLNLKTLIFQVLRTF